MARTFGSGIDEISKNIFFNLDVKVFQFSLMYGFGPLIKKEAELEESEIIILLKLYMFASEVIAIS